MSTVIVVEEEESCSDVEQGQFSPRDIKLRTEKWVTEEFDIFEFLGRGKFGEVKRCKERSSGADFAAKFISTPKPQDKKDVEHELSMMKKLQHKRLLQLYDAFEARQEMCLVLEIIWGGELFDRVIDDDFVLTEKACVCFMRQICEGVQYMHSINIIHLDLKPENILCLTRTGNRIKIIDFGLAREYNRNMELRVMFGTPEFMAPEVVNYDMIDFATDMWSIGVISYVLLSGLSPFMGASDGETLTNVIRGKFGFDFEEFQDISFEAKDMISKLLIKDKRQRLTAAECLEHAWLSRKLPENDHSNKKLSKKRLKRFVIRRKWQKIYNSLIALKRMGVRLSSIKRSMKLQQATNGDNKDHLIKHPTNSNTTSSQKHDNKYITPAPLLLDNYTETVNQSSSSNLFLNHHYVQNSSSFVHSFKRSEGSPTSDLSRSTNSSGGSGIDSSIKAGGESPASSLYEYDFLEPDSATSTGNSSSQCPPPSTISEAPSDKNVDTARAFKSTNGWLPKDFADANKSHKTDIPTAVIGKGKNVANNVDFYDKLTSDFDKLSEEITGDFDKLSANFSPTFNNKFLSYSKGGNWIASKKNESSRIEVNCKETAL